MPREEGPIPSAGTRTPPRRPALGRRLDRLALALLRVGRLLVGRPEEELLARLAAADRPGLRAPEQRWAEVEGAELHIAAGRAAFAAGQHAEALFRFRLALERAPEAAWAWHGRGDALQLLGRPADALAAYTRAAALAPETGLHQAGMANALAALGRAEEAEQAWRRALSLDPTLGWMRPGAGTG